MIGIAEMLPIRVCWDRFIDRYPPLIKAARDGVLLLLKELPRYPNVLFLGTEWTSGAYGSTDWYLDRATLPNGQVDANRLNQLLREEPWQRDPHLDLLLIGRDLTSEGNNFLYGQACANTNAQSVWQFFHAGFNINQVAALYRHVVFHELGHNFGLVPEGWPNSDARPDLYRGHCTSPGCAMRQFVHIGKLAKHVAPGGPNSPVQTPQLCGYCREFLRVRWS